MGLCIVKCQKSQLCHLSAFKGRVSQDSGLQVTEPQLKLPGTNGSLMTRLPVELKALRKHSGSEGLGIRVQEHIAIRILSRNAACLCLACSVQQISFSPHTTVGGPWQPSVPSHLQRRLKHPEEGF